jgi:predicted nucleic acid-binding protein
MALTNIRTYSFTKTDRVFFDTNIWLRINNPFAPEWNEKVKVYSNAYRDIINLNLKIHIDAVVLSEYINRLSRMRFDIWKVENPGDREIEFKKYRASVDFVRAAEAIELSVNEILMDCKPIDTNFSGINLVKLMDDFSGGEKDINDLLIVENCTKNNLVLVTDDADFRGMPIPILTYNQNLLRS